MRRYSTNYTLPLSLLARLDDASGASESRSRLVDLAIGRAYKDPERLVTSLRGRLALGKDQGESKRVTLTTDGVVYEKLQALASASHLPVEHVLRLAIEALITERSISLCVPEHIDCD